MTWTPPLLIDVAWKTQGAEAPSTTISVFVRALYSLLCHPLPEDSGDLDDHTNPDDDRFDLALRQGPGIPVKLGRSLAKVVEEVEKGAGKTEEHRRVVILLLDETAYLEGAEAFTPSFKRLVALVPERRYLLVLPVVLFEGWTGACGKISAIALHGASDQEKMAEVRRQVGVAIAQWISRGGQGRTRVFVSYARRDLPPSMEEEKQRRARRASKLPSARKLNKFLANETRLHTFFDAKDIEYGRDIAEQLREAGEHAILLSVRTDRQADSWWCQREMLTAKELRLPIVAVSILRRGQQRSSPYAGNVLEIAGSELTEAAIFDHIIAVWLRHVHFRLHGPAVARLVDLPVEPVLLSRPPELLDFALGVVPAGRGTLVLYPDPPLSTQEAQILAQAHPKSRLVTPTTLFGRLFRPDDPAPPLRDVSVAVSLSPSPDAPAAELGFHPEGFGAWHVDAAMAHVALCLIRTGATLAYGGHMGRTSYTRFLADLIVAHNRLGTGKDAQLDSFVPAYLVEPSFLVGLPQPRPMGKGIEGPASAPRQLVEMRRQMAEACGPRVVLGGPVRPRDTTRQTDGYTGRFPGVVEECYRTLAAGKPLYLIAGFGGGAKAVADILLGEAGAAGPTESALRSEVPDFDRLCNEYDTRTDLPPDDPGTLDEMMERIRAFGRALREATVDTPWNNGLTVAENRRLFESREPAEIAHLVIKGMIAWHAKKKSGEPPKLSVRLFHGNVADAPDVQAYAAGLFEGVQPSGDEAVLDERFGGAVRRVAERGEWPASGAARVVPAPGARLSGDWAVLASLGRLDDDATMPARLTRAYEQMLRCAIRHGIHDIALSPFGLAVGAGLPESIATLLDRIDAIRADVALTLCATDERDYQELDALLKAKQCDIDLHVLAADPFINLRPAAENPVTLHVKREGTSAIQVIHVAPADKASPLVWATPRALTPEQWAILAEVRSSGTPPAPHLLLKCGELLASLLPEQVCRTLDQEPDRPLDIIHDLDMAGVPWELLRITDGGNTLLPAIRGGIRRRILLATDADVLGPPAAPASTRSVLVIIDPKEDLQGAREEGDAIHDAFIKRPRVRAEFLRGRKATVASVKEALKQGWDAVHYAGHAQFKVGAPVESGLLLWDGLLNASLLQDPETRAPPFVFLNACESARVRGPDTPSTETPPTEAHAPLAEAMLRAGVQTLIGNFWEVSDRAAVTMARSFYEDVTNRRPFGKAVQRARKALHDAGSPHWANYMLYGDAERRW